MIAKMIPAAYLDSAKAIGLALIIGAAVFAGWNVQGWRLGMRLAQWQAELAQSRAQQQQEARRQEILSAAYAHANAELFEARKALSEAQNRTTTKEVIKYVQAPYAGHCQLPFHWVRIDTESATGMPSDVPSGPGIDGAPSGVTDATALPVIRDRNEICRAEIAKLASLQDYVKDQLMICGQEG